MLSWRGAREMDAHFASPLWTRTCRSFWRSRVWYRDVFGSPARAILPYEQRLKRFPAYLQQLEMESNGKSVRLDGSPVDVRTGPLVWGEPGTNGQHAFFQLLHQGTDVIPAEFMVAAEGHEPDLAHQHAMLVANCLAQSEALMRGRTANEARAQLAAMGRSPEDAARLAPHAPSRATGPPRLFSTAARPAHAGRHRRALRAPGLRGSRRLRHQCLRPVGRRARQGARDEPPAAGGRRGPALVGPGQHARPRGGAEGPGPLKHLGGQP